MPQLDWNDLRFALAVADRGSLAAGGRALGVSHTTVLRRVAALERRLGTRIFERLPSGHVLTRRKARNLSPRHEAWRKRSGGWS